MISKIYMLIRLCTYDIDAEGCKISPRYNCDKRPSFRQGLENVIEGNFCHKLCRISGITTMVTARLFDAIIHGCQAIYGNEASHNCHKNCCIDERHVLPESMLLNAHRERCRKGWQRCEHEVRCTNCEPLNR